MIAYRRWDAGGAGRRRDRRGQLQRQAVTPSTTSGLPRAGAWKVRFSSNDAKYSADFPATPTADVATTATSRDGFAQMGSLQLGAYQVLVLSQ